MKHDRPMTRIETLTAAVRAVNAELRCRTLDADALRLYSSWLHCFWRSRMSARLDNHRRSCFFARAPMLPAPHGSRCMRCAHNAQRVIPDSRTGLPRCARAVNPVRVQADKAEHG